MPFVLRRTKGQVLSELPPKIIQDVYCELSPLQRALYEDFLGSQVRREFQGAPLFLLRVGAALRSAPAS